MSHNTTNHNIHHQQHSHNIHSTSSHQMQTLNITNTRAISSLTLLFINKSLNLDYISYSNIILNPLIVFSTVSIYSISIFIYILVINSSYIEVITVTICLVLSVFSLILYILIKYNFIIVKNIHLIEMLLLSCSFVIFSSLNQTISSNINNVSQYFISIEIIVKCMWIVFILNEFIFVLCGSIINILIVIGYNCKGSNNNNIAILVAFVLLDCSHIVFAYFITRLNKEWFICRKMKVGLAEKECAFMDFGYIRVNADVNTNVSVSVEEKNEYVDKIFVDCDNEDVMDLLMEISDMNPNIKEKLIEIAKEKEKEENKRNVYSSGNNNNNNSKERESDFQTNDDLNFSNSNNNINQHSHNNASSIHFVNTSIGNHNTNNIKDNNSLHNDNDNNNESSFVGELPQTIKSGAHSQILVTTTHKNNTSQTFYHAYTPSQTHHHLSKPIAKFNKTTLSVNLNNKHRNRPSYNLNFDFLNKPSSNLINKPKPLSLHLPPPQQQEQPLNITETNPYEHILTDINTLLPLLTTYLKSLCDFNFIYLGKRKINLKEYSPEPNQNTGIMTTRSVFRGAVENSPTDYTHYKIYLRYNPILNSIEFIFVDESKKEYENIFKTFSKQTSMYLHDFKNPLIAINEKIIEYKDVFESILLECGEQEDNNNNNNNNQIACFQYGQSEVDDFNFLSLTSNDCVGMIKSYEDFARAFSEGTEQMRLNLSFFPLGEVTKYLQDWMNMKIIHSHTHSELAFIINANSIPGNYYIYTDQLKLKRILINIISNSFKFTLSGSITLVISKENINCVPYLKFLIKDTGSGMNEVTLKNLFNPYFSNNDDKRNKEGCGLGLILAMRMSKSIGLGINVKSEVNKGTEMWFYCEERPKPLGLSKEDEESSRRLGSLRKKEEYIVDMENNNNNNNNNNTCLSSGRNNNSNIKYNCSLKLSLRSSSQNPPRIKDLLPSSKTLSTLLNSRKMPNKHKLSINLHTTIHDDFLSMKRCSFENNKLPLSRNCNKHPTRKSQYMQHKQLLPLSQKSLVSVDFCDTTINDDYIMAISPNDKPVIITNNNSLRLEPKSNSVICVSHNLPNNSNNTVKSTLIQQRPIQALHQITVNNNTINNYKQTLISGNANEESNISNLSIIKQEAAISIEGKNIYNNNILSQTFHAANASGMNCNRGLNVYNYHKTKSNICSSNLNARSLISKKETLASACFTMGATSELGGNGLKKVHSLGKNITVLVVDDDEHFQKSYKRVLESLGVDEVVCINDGLDLLVMFLKGELNNFDAIIMDNFMTFVDGTEAVKVIKNMKDMGVGKKNILDYGVLNKIHIATSAQDLAMSSLEELSCIEFVEKPIGKEAMERIVKKCCVK